MLLRALRCLQRQLFTYLRSEKLPSRFYAFHSAVFGLSVFYVDQPYFQLLGTFFVFFYLSSHFIRGQNASALESQRRIRLRHPSKTGKPKGRVCVHPRVRDEPLCISEPAPHSRLPDACSVSFDSSKKTKCPSSV